MKNLKKLKYVAFVLFILCCYSCKKTNSVDPNQPVISLSSYKFTGKSGQTLTFTVNILAPNGAQKLIITKGVNVKKDSSYGTNGSIVIPVSGNTFVYTFSYVLSPDEVDKLVGFNFRIEDTKGLAAEKDFTLNTTVSGAQLLYTYRWNLKSKIWEKRIPEENIQPCEKDDSYLFNRDSSMVISYGQLSCTFDGFNIYTKWSLSPDESTLSLTHYNVFDPSKVTVDVYTIKTLTKDLLVMDIVYDLTAFGLSNHELFEFTYVPSKR